MLSRATSHNARLNGKFDFSVEPQVLHRNRPDTQKLNVSQDLVPSGHWIFGTIRLELRSRAASFGPSGHWIESNVQMDDEVSVQQEFGSDSKSFDLAHQLLTVSQTVSYESASGKDAPTYS